MSSQAWGRDTMSVRVECDAGNRGEVEPSAFWLGRWRHEVIEVADRWYGADCRYLRCQTGNGDVYILRQDEGTLLWDLAAFTAGPVARQPYCGRPAPLFFLPPSTVGRDLG